MLLRLGRLVNKKVICSLGFNGGPEAHRARSVKPTPWKESTRKTSCAENSVTSFSAGTTPLGMDLSPLFFLSPKESGGR